MNYQQSHNPIKYEPQNNSILEDKLMTHEGQLGYIQGKMESFATKENVKDLETKISASEGNVKVFVKDEISKLVYLIIAAIVALIVLKIFNF